PVRPAERPALPHSPPAVRPRARPPRRWPLPLRPLIHLLLLARSRATTAAASASSSDLSTGSGSRLQARIPCPPPRCRCPPSSHAQPHLRQIQSCSGARFLPIVRPPSLSPFTAPPAAVPSHSVRV